ncbi:MAG TPA: RodZ domain-containing protein [Xanthomonadaceae bacterium]|nr:RodZ domain-containing protein [Xanthomonadaceae bacterium]
MTDQANWIVPEGDRGCGRRLRQAREAAGLTQADVAARLKMPVRVVNSLEEEDWSRLGAPVFVRGQLRSYSRLLGLTTAPMVAAAGVATVEPPVLTPRTYTPPMRRFAEQAARRLVYIVITAAIAVPVWLATRPHLGTVARDAAPLDVPAVGDTTPAHAGPAAQSPRPLVASIAALPAAPETQDAPTLALRLHGDSWVEVTGRDGTVLEQGLLHAGAQRAWPVDDVGTVVLGDATAVDVLREGKQLDLAAFRRANVARFTVSSDGSLAPAAD